jgi:hypothetical protein
VCVCVCVFGTFCLNNNDWFPDNWVWRCKANKDEDEKEKSSVQRAPSFHSFVVEIVPSLGFRVRIALWMVTFHGFPTF